MTAPTGARPAGTWLATVADPGPPLQIILHGDPAPVPATWNSTYTPVLGDLVVVIQLGRELYVIGGQSR